MSLAAGMLLIAVSVFRLRAGGFELSLKHINPLKGSYGLGVSGLVQGFRDRG